MATALKLRYYGDPVLRKPARFVKGVGPAERMIIREMYKAMYAFDGAGLAAPQVGIDEQIFVVDEGQGPFAVLNPEILSASGKETVMEEGCLSLPAIRIHVKRPEVIRVRYLDENGKTIERELSGTLAKVFQHEIDHLNGRMIVDFATDGEREKYKVQLDKLEALSRRSSSAGR